MTPIKKDRANLITFILSNDFDYLIGQLKGQLYENSNILTRKLLVVPGDESLRFFEKSCLEDPSCGINFGYRPVNLNLCIESIYQTIDPDVKFPKRKSLRFALIETILKNRLSIHPELENFNKYLSSHELSLPFFNNLTRIYSSYALYGIEEVEDSRLKWQKIILDNLETKFDFPSKILKKPIPDLKILAGLEIHLFGFTMIPEEYLDFFLRISSVVPIYFYLPAVSQEITLDFMSDLAGNSNPLEKNPLLANFQGGLKPNLKFLIDESSFQREEFFIGKDLNEKESENLSLRKALIHSLLNAKLLQSEKKEKVSLCDDLLVIEAPNPYREVEELVSIIKRKIAIDRVTLDQIVILSPNMKDYAPLIAFVFEQNGLGYLIKTKLSFGETIYGEQDIFSKVLKSRFEKEDLVKLLSCKAIMKNIGLDDKSVSTMKKVVEGSSITFAFDADHRLSILKHCDPQDLYIGTVEHFFDQIYLGCAFSNDQLELLEFGKADKVLDQKVISDFSSLHALISKMNFLRMELSEKSKSLKEWIAQFLSVFELYFGQDSALELRTSFQDELEVSLNERIEGNLFYELLLEKIQDKRSSICSGSQNQILCTEFDEGVYLGKKLIYCIGADDQFLPTLKEKSSLDLSKNETAISPLKQQKAVFLQIVGLNSDYLYFSYSKTGFDQKEKILSLYVQKLIQYLDAYFETCEGKPISQFISKKVLEFNFSPANFEKVHLDQHSFNLYQASKRPRVFPSSILIKKNLVDEELDIDIKELALLLKNPVRFFVQKALKFPLPFIEENREFHLPNYQKLKVFKKVLHRDIDFYFTQMNFRGFFPHYGFSEIASQNLKKDCQSLKEKFISSPFYGSNGRKIRLRKKASKPISGRRNLVELPALKIKLNCGKLVHLVGALDEVSKHVMMIPSELKQDLVYKFWPEILLYSYCSKLLDEKENKVLFWDMESIGVDVESVEDEFKKLIDYYIMAKEKVSFFYDTWVKKLIHTQDSIDLAENFNEKRAQDPFLQFFSYSDSDLESLLVPLSSIYLSFEKWIEGLNLSKK